MIPLIGIVTPVRNRRVLSVAFAKRMSEQDYPLLRLYIVDSASTDGTPQALKESGLHSLQVVGVSSAKYWTGATNAGVVRALRDGCEYVLTINDDAIIPTDFVSNIVSAAVTANAKIVGSVISYADEPGRLWGVGAFNNWRTGAFVQNKYAGLWEDALDSVPLEGPSKLIRVDYLCGNGTLVHRSVFERIGLYDERRTPHYHADSEFTMRAEKAGIDRWVAPNARLYNRFSQSADGAFAAKNVRLFSLRSANCVRPLISILREYCPPELRGKALVFYFGRYLRESTLRSRSKLLRAIRLFTYPAEDWGGSARALIPPASDDLTFCHDIDILKALPNEAFILAIYMYFLRRACSDEELNSYGAGLASGLARERVIIEFVESSEYRDLDSSPLSFEKMLLLSPGRFGVEDIAAALPTLNDTQFMICCYLVLEGRSPSSAELRQAIARIQFTNRYDAALTIWDDSSDKSTLLKTLFSGHTRGPSTDMSGSDVPNLASDSSGRVKVLFNIDVLCMAALDPKAKTGVYRYAFSLLHELVLSPRTDMLAFYSRELEQGFLRLKSEAPGWLMEVIGKPVDLSQGRSVVFYPYFPASVARGVYQSLPTLVMLHDLFPVVRPEWFTVEATRTFKRQLHLLTLATHIFCNSRSTQMQLSSVFPNLSATSSVTFLAATSPERRSGRTPQDIFGFKKGNRYFLCTGTIEPRKNLLTVFAAYALLRERGLDDIDMVVVGEKGWNVDLNPGDEPNGQYADQIHLLGRISDDDLWTLYEHATCMVFPSLAEGFGLPILEASSCATPVITSNRSSMQEIMGDAGILVDPTDPVAIADAIAAVFSDKNLRAILSKKALLQAAKFSWRKCAEEHIEAFERVVSSSPALVSA